MTNVYGVTFVGARQQIANRLKEKEVVAEEDMYKCSIYITRQVRRPRGRVSVLPVRLLMH